MSLSPTLQIGVINSEGFREIDYMEYATDTLAQAAYVSDGLDVYGDNFITGGTPSADTEFSGDYDAAKACDGNVSTYWSSTNTTHPHWWKYDLGAAVTKTARKLTLNLANATHLRNFTLQGSNDDSAWTTIYTGVHANTAGSQTFLFENLTAYRFYKVEGTDNWEPSNWMSITEIYLYEITTAQSLQSYSESTIKLQGSYSLKGVATTGALNKTLTKTFSPVKDFSLIDTLRIGLRSSRTGSTIKLGVYDTGGVTSEKTPSVAAANTWETFDWDLSGVAVTNKDAISKFIITITDADAANTFYIDNFRKRSRKQTFVVFIPTIATGTPIGLLLALTYYNN